MEYYRPTGEYIPGRDAGIDENAGSAHNAGSGENGDWGEGSAVA